MQGTLWLVGMMGAGKSAVGALLAERLARPFVDADERIEAEAGQGIPAIFAAEGEAGFRARERRVVEGLAGEEGVVALGGGAVAQAGMAELLERTGTMTYLRARPETLLARVGEGETRPLLAGLDGAGRLARLEELLAERRAAYERAPIVVDTDDMDVDEVADAVVQQLGEAA